MEGIFILLSAGMAFATLYILWDWYILNSKSYEGTSKGFGL